MCSVTFPMVSDVLPEHTRGGKICSGPRWYSAAAQNAVFHEDDTQVSNQPGKGRKPEPYLIASVISQNFKFLPIFMLCIDKCLLCITLLQKQKNLQA